MSEHRCDIKTSESCVDPSLLMVERQDPDNFPRFKTRERCTLEIAAYVFKHTLSKMEFLKTLQLLIYMYIHKNGI